MDFYADGASGGPIVLYRSPEIKPLDKEPFSLSVAFEGILGGDSNRAVAYLHECNSTNQLFYTGAILPKAVTSKHGGADAFPLPAEIESMIVSCELYRVRHYLKRSGFETHDNLFFDWTFFDENNNCEELCSRDVKRIYDTVFYNSYVAPFDFFEAYLEQILGAESFLFIAKSNVFVEDAEEAWNNYVSKKIIDGELSRCSVIETMNTTAAPSQIHPYIRGTMR